MKEACCLSVLLLMRFPLISVAGGAVNEVPLISVAVKDVTELSVAVMRFPVISVAVNEVTEISCCNEVSSYISVAVNEVSSY